MDTVFVGISNIGLYTYNEVIWEEFKLFLITL